VGAGDDLVGVAGAAIAAVLLYLAAGIPWPAYRAAGRRVGTTAGSAGRALAFLYRGLRRGGSGSDAAVAVGRGG
ncbi:MAG: hypothetical protein WD099_04765, partial [Dongiaceae bacterium]